MTRPDIEAIREWNEEFATVFKQAFGHAPEHYERINTLLAYILELESALARETEECAKVVDALKIPSTLRLHAGEFTAQEMRTALAVLNLAQHKIRERAKVERYEILEDGPDRFALVDNESDEPHTVYPTREAAIRARAAREG